MKMKAQIMLRLEVPFEYDVDVLEVNTHSDGNRTVLVDPVGHERLADAVTEQRINAAKYAEKDLISKLSSTLPKNINILETAIEQVSEA